MRKKDSSNKKPRHNSSQEDRSIMSPDAVVPGLSVIREDENFFDAPREDGFDYKPEKKSDRITQELIEAFIVEFKMERKELWEFVKLSNSNRQDKLSEEELTLLYNAAHSKAGPKTISFKDLITQEFPPARYVIEPFFEVGAVNMLSAPPNNWKSWFLFYFASCIAQGIAVFAKFPTEKCGVLIVNEEDSHRSVQDRFKILKITDPSLEIYFRIASGAKLTRPFVLEVIEECKEKKLGLVMFDSLRSMHEADENDSTTMQAVMDMLKIIAREGITVIFTHHNRKKSMFSKGDDAEASRGSSAINAAISGYISLEEENRETGKFVVVRHLKSKVGKKIDPIEIKIIENEGTIEFNYEGEFKSGEKKLNVAKEAIMSILKPSEWKTTNEFFELEVAGKTVIRAALNSLDAEGVVVSITRSEARKKGLVPPNGGNPKEKLYSLPSEESELIQDEFDLYGKD